MLDRNILNFNNNAPPLSAINADYMVNLCAELSNDIYNPGYFIPPGWNLLHFYEDGSTGYKGAFYTRNLLTTNAQILIVNRGTVPNISNIIGDIQIALGHVPLQINSLNKFIVDAVTKLTKIYKPDDKEENDHLDMMRYLQTITTGHSMGAILADYIGLSATQTITFENPGSKPIIQSALIRFGYSADMVSSALNRLKSSCRAYQAGVNIINTCNEQVGRTFRVSPVDYEYKLNMAGLLLFPPPPDYQANLTYTIDYLRDQHSIAKLAKYITTARATIEVLNPIGFQAGYIEYLNPANKNYWDGYLHKIWTSDSTLAAGIRLKYNNDENAFKKVSYQELTYIYQKVSKGNLYDQPNEKLLNTSLNLFKPTPKDTDKIIEEFTLVEKPTPSRCSVM
jgi:hypothetical protein